MGKRTEASRKAHEKVKLKVLGRKLDASLAERPCAECTACCTAMGVQELDKPVAVTCEHVCETGCGIYSNRPPSCKSFQCLWRIGIGELEDRPDKSGIVLYAAHHNTPLAKALLAREVTPGAFETSRELIERLMETRVIVLISGDKPRRILGPQDEAMKIVPYLQQFLKDREAALAAVENG